MKGIFNPYAAPEQAKPKKKQFRATTDFKAPFDSEYQEPDAGKRTNISLDGDTYVIEFQNAKVEDVAKRLGMFFDDVRKRHQEELTRYGITFYPKGQEAEKSATALALPTPSGILYIETGNDKTEIAAYRRLGYALVRMPVKETLKKHAMRAYMRG